MINLKWVPVITPHYTVVSNCKFVSFWNENQKYAPFITQKHVQGDLGNFLLLNCISEGGNSIFLSKFRILSGRPTIWSYLSWIFRNIIFWKDSASLIRSSYFLWQKIKILETGKRFEYNHPNRFSYRFQSLD